MLRKTSLLALLSLAMGEWDTLDGKSRIKLMDETMNELMQLRAERVISYLLQSTDKYFPEYEELLAFLKLVDSIDETDYQWYDNKIIDSAYNSTILLHRLLYVPLEVNKVEEVSSLLERTLINHFIVSLEDNNISLNFYRVLVHACQHKGDYYLCNKQTKYIKRLVDTVYRVEGKLEPDLKRYSPVPSSSRGNHMVPDTLILPALIDEIKRVENNPAGIDESFKHLLAKFPWLYEMYIGNRRVFDILLKNEKNVAYILETSPISFFRLRRNDSLVSCQHKLGEIISAEDSPLYEQLSQRWTILPINCFDGEDATSTLEAQKLHYALELYGIALMNPAMRTFPFTFEPTEAQLDAMSIVAQIGLSDVEVYKKFPTHVYSVCKLFDFPKYLAMSVKEKAGDVSTPLINLYSSTLTHACNKDALWRGVEKYVIERKTKPLPFPLALLKHYTDIPLTQDQQTRLNELKPSADNLDAFEKRKELIWEIRSWNFKEARKIRKNRQEFLFENIDGEHFFHSEFIPVELFKKLKTYYSDELVRQATVRKYSIHRGDLFSTFLGSGREQSITFYRDKEMMMRIFHENSQQHNLGRFFGILRAIDFESEKITRAIHKYRENERDLEEDSKPLIPYVMQTLLHENQKVRSHGIHGPCETGSKLSSRERLACLEAIALKVRHHFYNFYQKYDMDQSDIEKAEKYLREIEPNRVCYP